MNKMKTRTLSVAMAIAATTSYTQPSFAALEEVVVTAQKRTQNLQDVPVAVTAITETMMADENIFDIADLTKAVPSISIVKGYNKAAQTPVFIRGIGTLGTSPSFEGSVGTYFDGIYRSRPGMALSTLLDVGRIEVLKGPQGTLFGKNNTAGAVTIYSIDPSHEFGYGGEVTLGDYDRQRVVGYVEGGLTDNIAARLSGMFDQRDGFTEAFANHDDYGELDTTAYKLNVVWDATDTLTAKVILDYSDSTENCCFGNQVPLNREGGLTDGPLGDYYLQTSQANFDTGENLLTLDPNDRKNQNNVNPNSDNTDWGIMARLDWSLDAFDITSITGYRDWKYKTSGDADFAASDLLRLTEDYKVDTFSQEFNFSGMIGERVDYVTGLYYSNEDFHQDRPTGMGADIGGMWELFWSGQTGFPPSALQGVFGSTSWANTNQDVVNSRDKLNSETKAVFGHFTIKLAEQWNLILAARYSEEEKTLDRKNTLYDDINDYAAYLRDQQLGTWLLGSSISGPDINGLTYKDSEWTYDAKVQFFATEDIATYLGYSHGFKAGGINLTPDSAGGQPSGLNSPEVLALQGTGNGTGFADPVDPTYEPEYIDTWELGLKSSYHEGSGRFNAAVFYNEIDDLQISLFTGTQFEILNASKATIFGVELENTYQVTDKLRIDLSMTYLDSKYDEDVPDGSPAGRELNYAPKWAGAAALAYEHPISSNLVAYSNLNWAYRGDQNYTPTTDIGSYQVVGLQIGLRDASDTWDVRVWCDNCADETYGTFHFNSPFYFQDVTYVPYESQFLGAPRTIGATLRLNF
jgi:iron complex outermembrane recepter protein